jgi:hypothetical protein
MPDRYRKRPVVVEAMQWDGTPEGAEPIINWVLDHDGNATYWCRDPKACAKAGHATGKHDIRLRTLEGDMLARPTAFVVRGMLGEFYPVRSDIFVATYDRE